MVIVARKVGGGEHVTTYGVDPANCEVAARIGEQVFWHLDAPCHLTPQCVRKLFMVAF